MQHAMFGSLKRLLGQATWVKKDPFCCIRGYAKLMVVSHGPVSLAAQIRCSLPHTSDQTNPQITAQCSSSCNLD
jgi:hypothetical protein